MLRINRPFMQYARAHYAEAAKQQFNKTIVDDSGAGDSGADAGAPAAALPPPAAPPSAPACANRGKQLRRGGLMQPLSARILWACGEPP